MPRLEHDFLGEMRIPSDTYYGIQTYRAVENFPISGVSIASFPELIKALGLVKKASAIANMQFGVLPREIGGRHLRGLRRDHRGQAARSVPRGLHSGRRGNFDQHERQRGHRQPRP